MRAIFLALTMAALGPQAALAQQSSEPTPLTRGERAAAAQDRAAELQQINQAAFAAYQAEDYVRAANLFDRAFVMYVELAGWESPLTLQAANNLGESSIRAGRLDVALEVFLGVEDLMLEFHPDHESLGAVRSTIRYLRGELGQAQE
ncbi:MAG: hypothetical protein KIS81_03185 [Maricaulaceae bacterium]|nr:hypothetical protein [Maricaulaceae bacterium]